MVSEQSVLGFTTMAETRSQTLARETEEIISSKMTALTEKLESNLQSQLSEMNDSMKGSIAELFASFEAFAHGQRQAQPNLGRQPPSPIRDTGQHSSSPANLPDANRWRSGGNLGQPQAYSAMTRLARLDFPRFSGANVKDWLFKAEQFFLIDKTPEEIKVSLASIHLEDKAATWHQSIAPIEAERGTFLDWGRYRQLLLDRFGEVIDDPMAELMQLRESDGIVDYNDRFEMIRTRVVLPESYLVSAYLTGLRNDTQMHIRMFKPDSVRTCFMLGKLYEMAHPKQAGNTVTKHNPISRFSAGNPKGDNLKNGFLGNKDQEGTKSVAPSNTPRKFLTPAEMSERRAKGLCYQCDEPYTPTHYLKHKKSQLFYLEAEEVEDEVALEESLELEEAAQISVNAVAGVSNYRTMRVKGMFGKKALFILIDSGSTHNFIDQGIAAKLGCTLLSYGLSKVSVADGSTLDVSAKIENFKWQFQQVEFQADLMVIPLGCCDMVLGVQWLETLGKILWDFKQLTMEFKVGHKRLVLQGIIPGSAREIRAQALNKVWCSDSQLAMLYIRDASSVEDSNPVQQQWLPKLLEFDYDIQYKEGKENLVADALSRVEGSAVLSMALSMVESDLLAEIQLLYEADTVLKEIIAEFQTKGTGKKHYTWSHQLLRRKGKLVIGNSVALRDKIMSWLHCSGTSGHSGRDATFQRVKSLFYWKGLANDIQTFLRNCVVCQRSKYDRAASPGLIQPLPIPSQIWSDITMDFVEGLPMSCGKSVIFVVVDRLSKAAHFVALSHPYTASSVAQAFLDNVFRLHGFPQSITSDRDAIFLSDFGRELFTVQGVALNYSTAYHPQTDGQSEVVNRCLETYLRCICSDKPHLWCRWLPLAEWWYNTTFHTSAQLTPYEVVYGQAPPGHLPYLPGETKVEMVARSLQERENMIQILRFHLMRAQHRMEQLANKHRSERSFEIGDLVYVKLQPYRQQSVVSRATQKLAPKYFGPFPIADRCGAVAYKVILPDSSRIHPVFHVSQLKKHVGGAVVSTTLPSIMPDPFVKAPEAILEVQHHSA
ncbi:hypothetical protein V2J09_000557 [Rumex salicifolius]